jgi:hypothetical protein
MNNLIVASLLFAASAVAHGLVEDPASSIRGARIASPPRPAGMVPATSGQISSGRRSADHGGTMGRHREDARSWLEIIDDCRQAAWSVVSTPIVTLLRLYPPAIVPLVGLGLLLVSFLVLRVIHM